MKIRNTLLVLLAASSLAIAQGGGGNGGGSAGGGTNPSGGMASPSGGDMAASAPMSHSKPMKKHTGKSAKKPATDTTNTPGADASSDTKGQ